MSSERELIGRRIIPSEEQQVLSLEAQREEARDYINSQNSKREKFESKYGEDLFAYSLAYARRDRNGKMIPVTELRGEKVLVDDIIESLSGMIVSHMESAYEEDLTKEEWMTQYLRDIEGLRT